MINLLSVEKYDPFHITKSINVRPAADKIYKSNLQVL